MMSGRITAAIWLTDKTACAIVSDAIGEARIDAEEAERRNQSFRVPDRFERNRSRFIAEAVEHELVRRRREGLLRSLESPHPEAVELEETGFADWSANLPADDDGLVDVNAGKAVRWVEGQGWVQESA